MKKRISIDSLMNQTLGFNTKSFSESKTISVNKKFNYGELGNAMLVFEIDRYMMKAEAANSRTRLATQFATGEASIVDSVKKGVKNVWEIIKKLLTALLDLITNFINKMKARELVLLNLVSGLITNGVVSENGLVLNTFFSPSKINEAMEKGKKFKVVKAKLIGGMVDAKYDNTSNDIFSPLEPIQILATGQRISSNNLNNFLDKIVPDGADDDMTVQDFTKLYSGKIEKEKDTIRKNSKANKKIEYVEVDAKTAVEYFTLGMNEVFMQDVIKLVKARPLLVLENIKKSIKLFLYNIKSNKDIIMEENDKDAVSNANVTKVRVALNIMSSYVTVASNALNLKYANLQKVLVIPLLGMRSLMASAIEKEFNFKY